jgi:hypothetical protein
MLTVGSNIDFFLSVIIGVHGEKNAHIFWLFFFLHFWVIAIIVIICHARDLCVLDASVIIIINLRLIFSLCIIFTMYMPHCTALSPHFEKVIIIVSFNIAFFVHVCMSCYRKLHLIIINVSPS